MGSSAGKPYSLNQHQMYSFQSGFSTYPTHYRQALASNPILLTHKPTVISRICALVSYSITGESMGGCLVPSSPFSLPLDSLFTPSYFLGVLWSEDEPPYISLFPFWDCLSVRFGNWTVMTLRTRVRRLIMGNYARWDLTADSVITTV